MQLSPAMKAEMSHLMLLKLPKSWEGFPGHPATTCDMRSISALEKRGLVESVIHQWSPDPHSLQRAVICYRLTETGRKSFNPMWVLNLHR